MLSQEDRHGQEGGVEENGQDRFQDIASPESVCFAATFPRNKALFNMNDFCQRPGGMFSWTGASLHQMKTCPFPIILRKKSLSSPVRNFLSNRLSLSSNTFLLINTFPVRVFCHFRTVPVSWDGLSKNLPLRTHAGGADVEAGDTRGREPRRRSISCRPEQGEKPAFVGKFIIVHEREKLPRGVVDGLVSGHGDILFGLGVIPDITFEWSRNESTTPFADSFRSLSTTTIE